MYRFRVFASVCLLVVLGGVGCQSQSGTSFKTSTRRITIHSQPVGAKVTLIKPLGWGEQDLGHTPIEDYSVMVLTEYKSETRSISYAMGQMQHMGNVVVRLEKPGYHPKTATLNALEMSSNHTITLTPFEDVTAEARGCSCPHLDSCKHHQKSAHAVVTNQ
ncbi:hypothetical protein [Poriferisphaera sp. WC338]|uniref:hypothetical protein n=1 Tax=Poriferisphaera sp. WC338 TaxID=3425129 RepID=UPI003D81988F